MVSSTLRVPDDVHDRLKAKAAAEGRSINEVVVEILDRETRRWQALNALEAANRIREEIRQESGELTSSVDLIREIREERSNRA